jgi:hypothetical protein
MKLMTTINNATGRAGLQIKKHSPEILMGAGVIGFIGTIVLACKATTRAEEVLDRHARQMEDAKEAAEIAEPEDNYDIKKETLIVYSHTAVDMAKLYGPTIAMGTLSLACFLKAYKIVNNRYLGAVAAYNAVSSVFDIYRNRVREELGEQMDRHFRYGSEISEIETIVDEGDGKKPKKTKEKVENTDSTNIGPSEYAKFFDKSCPEWDTNPQFNLKWLRANETAANDILNSRGHIFLNEVYDMIGLPHTSAGAVVGWVKGHGDGYVDFGLYKPDNESARRFINGEDNVVLLDFNVDGVIFDLI